MELPGPTLNLFANGLLASTPLLVLLVTLMGLKWSTPRPAPLHGSPFSWWHGSSSVRTTTFWPFGTFEPTRPIDDNRMSVAGGTGNGYV